MLAIPLRRTEYSQVGQALKQCIEVEYHQNADKYVRDVDCVDNARAKAAGLFDDIDSGRMIKAQDVEPIKAYIDLLVSIQRKFPSSIQTDFVWYNSLGYTTNAAVSYSSLQFDMANMQYNIAAIYCQYAVTIIERSSQHFEGSPAFCEDLKSSFNYFQLAAGALKKLQEQILPMLSESISQQLPIGLDEDTIHALYFLMLAQAQESFWQRATFESLKDQSVAKLSSQVSKYYSMCHGFMLKASASFKAEWLAHVQCKKLHFQAAAHYRMAVDSSNKAKYGLEISHLQAALKYGSEAVKLEYLRNNQLVSDANGLLMKTKTELERAERDNDLIYYQPVPAIGEVACSNMANAREPDNANVNGRIAELFEGLLPYQVYQVSSAFKEKLVEFAHNNIIRRGQDLNADLEKSLMHMSLPGSLDALEEPLGVPDRLLEMSEELRAMHGISQLKLSLNDIDAMGEESLRLLQEASESLLIDEKEDEFMRQKYGSDAWSRLPPRNAAADLWSTREELEQYLNMGRKGDMSLKNSFASIEDRLMILESGKAALEQHIPIALSVKWGTELERAIAELRQALQRARGMVRQRLERLKEIEIRVSQLNLLPKITKRFSKEVQRRTAWAPYKVEPTVFDSIYSEELAEFNSDLDWVHQEGKQQEELLTLITKRNKLFLQVSRADISMLQRQDVVQQFEQVFYKFNEIQRNLKEAHHFYNHIRIRLQDLCNQCKTFVYNRRIEAQALEQKFVL